jgi:hypothetical protein
MKACALFGDRARRVILLGRRADTLPAAAIAPGLASAIPPASHSQMRSVFTEASYSTLSIWRTISVAGAGRTRQADGSTDLRGIAERAYFGAAQVRTAFTDERQGSARTIFKIGRTDACKPVVAVRVEPARLPLLRERDANAIVAKCPRDALLVICTALTSRHEPRLYANPDATSGSRATRRTARARDALIIEGTCSAYLDRSREHARALLDGSTCISRGLIAAACRERVLAAPRCNAVVSDLAGIDCRPQLGIPRGPEEGDAGRLVSDQPTTLKKLAISLELRGVELVHGKRRDVIATSSAQEQACDRGAERSDRRGATMHHVPKRQRQTPARSALHTHTCALTEQPRQRCRDGSRSSRPGSPASGNTS